MRECWGYSLDQEEFKEVDNAIALAIDRVLDKGSDDLFRPPVFSKSIESKILEVSAEDFRKDARNETLKFLKAASLEQRRIGPTRRSLVAKDENTFRQVAWLDPFDVVKYLSVAILAFKKIESLRPPKSANIVHSHRKSDLASDLFDDDFGYDSFRAESSRISKERIGQWKVITDISNFFDRVGNHTLENHLLDSGLDRKYARLVSEVLFFWAGDRRSFGLPVGSDASRILSEAVLIDVDRKLIEHGVAFVRYVDDYRLFAASKAEALKCVEQLTSLLADEGLALNSRKTEIVEIISADEVAQLANRFGAGEHETLDLEKRVEMRRRIRVSGRSAISKFYRKPGQEALTKLKALDKDEIEASISECEDYQFEDVLKTVVKFFVHVDQDVGLITKVLDRRLTSIIYLADALTKEAENLSREKCGQISETIFDGYDWLKCAYPLQVPILRLSAHQSFLDARFVNDIVARHSQLDSLLFFREAIAIGHPCLDRARIRRLAIDVFGNVPAFVQRAIYFAVASHHGLSDEEKRPLLKNMKQHSQDWFIDRAAKIIQVAEPDKAPT